MNTGESAQPEQSDASYDEAYLSDGSRMAQWEEDVATSMLSGVDPENLESWSARPRLPDLLRMGLSFHGPLLDIQIVPEPDARETLTETLGQKPKPRLATDYFNKPPGNLAKIPPERMRSFLLTASAHSAASPEKIGDVYAQIWYEIIVDPRNPDQAVDIRRYVMGPIADEAAFQQLAHGSKRIGRYALEAALSKAYSSGMSGVSQGEKTRRIRIYSHQN